MVERQSILEVSMSNLAQSVSSEYSRFRNLLSGAPNHPGSGKYIEVQSEDGSKAAIQGQEESFLVTLDGLQVHYEQTRTAQGEPILERQILLSHMDDSNPDLGRFETDHRDTVIREKQPSVLGDDLQHTVALYPGKAGVRQGFVVENSDLTSMPYSAEQKRSMDSWNIAH